MLERKMMDRLRGWKDAGARKAFVLLGARQTGKTHVVRRFAQECYDDFVEVNFLDRREDASFLSESDGAEELLSRLSLLEGRSIPAGTLIFLDEVQHIGADVVTLSKFVVEDGRYDLVMSGSLLGTVLEGVTSFPVGYAQVERMYPLDFEEFCSAVGVPNAILDQIREAYRKKVPVTEALHERMVKVFRQYIAVGGMPEAVQSFLDNRRALGAAREVDLAVVEQYRYDISRYVSTSRRPVVQTIFDNIPSQLAKENKRFMLRSIKAGATYERLDHDFAWLTKAGVALPAHLVREPRYPLERTRVAEKFKLYSSDCGVLLSQYPTGAAVRVASGTGDANFGAVYENVVAQELLSAGFPLRYYHHSKKGEVDFLIETSEGTVLPIEVKSGKDYKLHTALNNLLGTKEYGIDCAYALSEHNVSRAERMGKPVYYLPLYMVMCLSAERGESELHKTILEAVGFEDLL